MAPDAIPAARLVPVMFAAAVLGMAGIVAYPALVPTFKAAWGLSNTAAGWISGVYFAGYAGAVPILSALTDRIDARRIVLAGMALSTVAPIGFALTAEGLVSASFWWGLQGIGFAGIYLPGLRALSDRIDVAERDHAAAVFTATFTFGVSVSFTLTGLLAEHFGWRGAFLILAAGPLAGLALVAFGIAPQPKARSKDAHPLFDFRPAFRNRRALAYSIGYAVHNGESAVVRAWIVALLAFAASRQSGFAASLAPTTIAALMTLLGLPAVILASKLTRIVERRRVIAAIMALSASTGVALGFATGHAFVIVFAIACFYGFIVPADSGILNAGLLSRAAPERQGTSMAVHAVFGFTAAFLMPFAFGAVLDLAGGTSVSRAWITAFAVLAVFIAIGPLALFALDRESKT